MRSPRTTNRAVLVRFFLWALIGALIGWLAGGSRLAIAGIALGSALSIAHSRRATAMRACRRHRQILIDLPDALELLASTVDGGAPPTDALARVSGYLPMPLSGLLRSAAEAAAGEPLGASLRNADPVLRPLGALLQQCDELGVPIAQSLRLLAADARLRARAEARERAAAAGPRMLLVVGGLLAPAALLIVIGGQALALQSLIGPVLE